MSSAVPDWLQVAQAVGETIAGVGAVAAVLISLVVLKAESRSRRAEMNDRKEAAARLVTVARDNTDASTMFGGGRVKVSRPVIVHNRGVEPVREVVLRCDLVTSDDAPEAMKLWSVRQSTEWDVIAGGDSEVFAPAWSWPTDRTQIEQIIVHATVEFTDVSGHRWLKALDGTLFTLDVSTDR
ncbi:hypothetical protein [Cellulomonas alba]|uniref:Uncharacterized protein n=1 Tax=Cellulomonas alba TaxID=3053467 RepID=A0ABT7SKR3_9CELL|nr:hypothetical protein [Cellulomonas alba]MDM7856624.1 hypothetical protein [Cellulomonas alba]